VDYWILNSTLVIGEVLIVTWFMPNFIPDVLMQPGKTAFQDMEIVFSYVNLWRSGLRLLI
jgi:hypothetical protein